MNPFIDQLSDTVSKARTLEELTRPLLEMLEAVTGLESAFLTSVDEAKGVQHIVYAHNSRNLQIPEDRSLQWNDSPCKRAQDDSVVFTNQVLARWPDLQVAQEIGLQTYAGVPVRTSDGGLYGTLCAVDGEARPHRPHTEQALRLFAHLIAQQAEREQLIRQLVAANDQLAAAASTDQLTGLPNRRALMATLTRMLAYGQRQQASVLIAFIDLDGFKAVNDRHGHDVGDQLLIAMAERLQRALRAEDIAARLGGDEFILAGMGSPSGGADPVTQGGWTDRIAEATRGRFALPGATLDYPGASVGVVTVAPGAVQDAQEALRLADQAMYRIKQARKSV
ncbi:sensor domain-containing diguanylate cyclase [Acidovorax sp. Leaf160]|uniref:sensor domain-containing diguanylate cyclase n=1 Tax=Acidovorax sp. Leaf160 TaxID=1736280 RepID=UPI0006FC8BA0|nr:sensor domain-containing diguanylate cyclase [Acidovorax sp. Leaf160]KQR42789.1 diguanylate cyclase [Acidovorax sp. Leaf160]